MISFLTRSFILLLFCAGCSGAPRNSDFTRALTAAVKEEYISEKKKVYILKEYEMLWNDDKDKAREYVLQMINALEMGGDSTHIDVVRNQFLPVRKGG